VVSNRNDFNWEPRRSKDWKKPPSDAIETRYELKARKVGQPCVYLSFRKV
jgi:tRNA G46 methylase TrmB